MTHGHLIDAAGNRILLLFCPDDLALVRALGAQAEALCSWSGADILAVFSPQAAQWRAHFWNPDGTEESLCGNALRAAAKVLCAPGERSAAVTSRHTYAFGSSGDVQYFETARRDVDVLDRGDGQLDVVTAANRYIEVTSPFKLIKTDRTGDIPKSLCLPTGIANQ